MALETMNTGAMRSPSAMFDSRMAPDRAVSALKTAGIADLVLTGGENEGYGTRQYSTEAGTNRGFFESIGDFFFPKEDRHAYAEGLNRGGYLRGGSARVNSSGAAAEWISAVVMPPPALASGG